MTATLTPDELSAMRQRCEDATAGPWVASGPWVDSEGASHYGVDDNTDIEVCACFDASTSNAEQDSDFISHARSDVPRLIAEVERLREIVRHQSVTDDLRVHEVERLQSALEEFQAFDGDGDLWAEMKRDRDEARKEVERLLAAIEAIPCEFLYEWTSTGSSNGPFPTMEHNPNCRRCFALRTELAKKEQP